MVGTTHIAVFACLVLPFILAVPVYAEDHPTEGEFSITYTSLNAAPIKPIDIGNGLQYVVSNDMMTAVNDDGYGLLHGMAGRCLMSTTINTNDKTFQQRGYCTYTDRDGDQVFEKLDFEQQPLGAALVAKGQWAGGTGKWAGLEGDIDIRHTPVKSPVEGIVQGAGKKHGRFKITKVSSAK